MAGTTIVVTGKTGGEVIEEITKQIKSGEEMGLWLDSGISIIKKDKFGERILGGEVADDWVYQVYYREKYKDFEGFIGICHLHS